MPKVFSQEEHSILSDIERHENVRRNYSASIEKHMTRIAEFKDAIVSEEKGLAGDQAIVDEYERKLRVCREQLITHLVPAPPKVEEPVYILKTNKSEPDDLDQLESRPTETHHAKRGY